MKSKINPAIYFFSLFYFVYVVISDFGYIVTSPSLLILTMVGVAGFVYGYPYTKKD